MANANGFELQPTAVGQFDAGLRPAEQSRSVRRAATGARYKSRSRRHSQRVTIADFLKDLWDELSISSHERASDEWSR